MRLVTELMRLAQAPTNKASDKVSAIAGIPKIEAAMQRVVELDEFHDDGGAHLYLGALEVFSS